MVFNLLLASIRILSCFFLFFFLAILSNCFVIPIVKEEIEVKLALAVPAGAPITLAKWIIGTSPLVALKTIKTLSM